jgi:hypothetical protein
MEARTPIYLVLGMHRGGTSAIGRGLQALGVSLGDNLMPPADDNERGFWEDMDVMRLNEDVLTVLGERWHSVRMLEEAHSERSVLDHLVSKGQLIVGEKTRAFAPFGFKDPRATRLLFYWQAVFDSLELEPRYVIALRNPLSVIQSLQRRDGFPAEKSHMLWLEHMVSALRWTEGQTRVVVDYDRLLAEPLAQLLRLREALSIPAGDEAPLHEYASEFLSDDLRHYRFDPAHLQAAHIPPLTARLHHLLDRLARDEVSEASSEVRRKAREMWARLVEIAPALAFAERESQERERLARVIDERDARINDYAKVVADRDYRLNEYAKVVADRDYRLNEYAKVVADRDRRTAELRSLAREVGRRSHAQALARQNLEDSSFWRATRGLRLVWGFLERRLCGRNYRFRLVPNDDLEPLAGDFEWKAVGPDPSFEMVPIGGAFPSGWINLRTTLYRASTDFGPKLYYAVGSGLNEENGVAIEVASDGVVDAILRLPSGIKHLRWDLTQVSGDLTQLPIVIARAEPVTRFVRQFVQARGAADGSPHASDVPALRTDSRHR